MNFSGGKSGGIPWRVENGGSNDEVDEPYVEARMLRSPRYIDKEHMKNLHQRNLKMHDVVGGDGKVLLISEAKTMMI